MKSKIHLYRICALLALTQLCTAFCACGAESDAPVETSAAETTPAAITDPVADYKLAEKDFGGREVNINLWHLTKLVVTEETGDIVSDAIYKRNTAIMDKYNVEFKYKVGDGQKDYGDWLANCNASIMAGDDQYQLIGGYGYRLASDSLGGNYANLLDLPYIDFSMPWRPSNIMEQGNLDGTLTIALGNIEPDFYG